MSLSRIAASSIKEQSTGDSVRFVAKVISFDEKEAVVENDGTQIKVIRPTMKNYTNTTYVEVFGKVTDPALSTVEESKSIPFGTKFSKLFAQYTRLCDLALADLTSRPRSFS